MAELHIESHQVDVRVWRDSCAARGLQYEDQWASYIGIHYMIVHKGERVAIFVHGWDEPWPVSLDQDEYLQASCPDGKSPPVAVIFKQPLRARYVP